MSESTLALRVLNQDELINLVQRFNANIQAFKKYTPSLLEPFNYFQDYEPKRAFSFVTNDSGSVNIFWQNTHELFYPSEDAINYCEQQVARALTEIKYKVELRQYRITTLCAQIDHRYRNEIMDLTNGYDAEREQREKSGTQAILNLASKGCAPFALIFGAGLGYHLNLLHANCDIITTMLIEPDVDVFYASLFCTDYANLLAELSDKNYSIHFFIGSKHERLLMDMSYVFFKLGAYLANFAWNYIHYQSPELMEVAKEVQDYYKHFTSVSGFIDDDFFSISHNIAHVRKGIGYLDRAKRLSEETKRIPVCVVANGPSLKQDLALLRKVQDKVFIIACGSALNTLYMAGIQAHAYCALERAVHSYDTFIALPDKSYLENCQAFVADCCIEKTFEPFKKDNCHIVLLDSSCFTTLLKCQLPKQAAKLPLSFSFCGPLVGNLGLSLAVNLGFENIYLFGLDNGTKSESAHNADDKTYQAIHQTFSSYAFSRQALLCYESEGNFGGKVRTSKEYLFSASQAERAIMGAKERGQQIFNCSDGTKLKGVEPKHSSELLENFSSREDLDLTKLNQELATLNSYLEISEAEVTQMLAFEQVDQVFEKVAGFIANMKASKSRLEYIVKLNNLNQLLSYIDNTMYGFVARMLYGSLNGMLGYIIKELYYTKDEAESFAHADAIIEKMEYFLADARACYKFLPKFSVEENFEYFNGKLGFDHPNSSAPDSPNPNELRAALRERVASGLKPKFEKRYS